MTFELYEEFLRAMGELRIRPSLLRPPIPGGELFLSLTPRNCFFPPLPPPRSTRQAGGDTRSVFCNRSAQQDTPQHAGAPHLPSGQVCDEITSTSAVQPCSNNLHLKGAGWCQIPPAMLFCFAGRDRALDPVRVHHRDELFSGVFQDRAAGGHEQDVSQRPRHRVRSLRPSLPRHHRPTAERPGHQQNHRVRAAPSRACGVAGLTPANADLPHVGAWSWSSTSR